MEDIVIKLIVEKSDFEINLNVEKPNIKINEIVSKLFKGEQGKQGLQGETGNGIVSIIKTSTDGLIDTYTILFSNGEKTTYTITNGKTGADGKNAYQFALEGGYTGTEEEFTQFFNNIITKKDLENFITEETLNKKGFVPDTRTINGKPLTSDITLTASDVKALEEDDVFDWAKQPSKPEYDYSEIKNKPIGIEKVELLYDKTSNDANINWGYTAGIKGGATITNKSFQKYKYLRISFFSYSTRGQYMMDLTSTMDTGISGYSYMGNGIINAIDALTEFHYCFSAVDSSKTSFKNWKMGYVKGEENTERNDSSKYYIEKIEGVY